MPTDWFHEQGQRQKCIDEGKSLDYKFFITRQFFRSKNKITYKDRAYEDYTYYMNTDFKEGGHDYEVLQGKFRLLMDLDLKWSDNDDILHRIIHLILQKLHQQSISGAKVLWIGTSHIESKKRSYHVIFNVFTENISLQKYFFEELQDAIEQSGTNLDLLSADTSGGFIIDMSMYSKNHLFRMHQQSKATQDRTILSHPDYKDIPFENTLGSYVGATDILLRVDKPLSTGHAPRYNDISSDTLIQLLAEAFPQDHPIGTFLYNGNLETEDQGSYGIRVRGSSANGFCIKKNCHTSHHPSIRITKNKIYGDCHGDHCKENISFDTPQTVKDYLESMRKKITFQQALEYPKPSHEKAESAPAFSGNKIIVGSKHCPAISFGE